MRQEVRLVKRKNDTSYFLNEIRYQPIFIDLNNKKTSLSERSINCVNPKLSSKYVDLYKKVDIFVSSRAINNKYFVDDLEVEKICKKYAKF